MISSKKWMSFLTLLFFIIGSTAPGNVFADGNQPSATGGGSNTPTKPGDQDPGQQTSGNNSGDNSNQSTQGDDSALRPATPQTREEKAKDAIESIGAVCTQAHDLASSLDELSRKNQGKPYETAIRNTSGAFSDAISTPPNNLSDLEKEAKRLYDLIRSNTADDEEKDSALESLQDIQSVFTDGGTLDVQVNYYEGELSYLQDYLIPAFETELGKISTFKPAVESGYESFKIEVGKILAEYDSFIKASPGNGVLYLFDKVSLSSFKDVVKNVDSLFSNFEANITAVSGTSNIYQLRSLANSIQSTGQTLTGDSGNSFTGIIEYYKSELDYFKALYEPSKAVYQEFNSVITAANDTINAAAAKITAIQNQIDALNQRAAVFGDSASALQSAIQTELSAQLESANKMLASIRKSVNDIADFITHPTSTAMTKPDFIKPYLDSVKAQVAVLNTTNSANPLAIVPDISQKITRFSGILDSAESIRGEIKVSNALIRAINRIKNRVDEATAKSAKGKILLANLDAVKSAIQADIANTLSTILNPATKDTVRAAAVKQFKNPAQRTTWQRQIINYRAQLHELRKNRRPSGRGRSLGRRYR